MRLFAASRRIQRLTTDRSTTLPFLMFFCLLASAVPASAETWRDLLDAVLKGERKEQKGETQEQRGESIEQDDAAEDFLENPSSPDSPALVPERHSSSRPPIEAGESRVFNGIEFVWIPAGEFRMGSTSRHAEPDEKPVTRVRITQGFWLGKYEVTQRQWQRVMGSNPSRFRNCGGDCPVERVSWNYVQEFIANLNRRSGGRRFRLPTEAEWEYAARAGTTTDTYSGDITAPRGNDPVLNRIAWYWESSGNRTHPVGRKAPNAWGLHDMLGNVREWVADWKGGYQGGTVKDPAGPSSGSDRVSRGCSWFGHAGICRSAHRHRDSPGYLYGGLGFRLLRE